MSPNRNTLNRTGRTAVPPSARDRHVPIGSGVSDAPGSGVTIDGRAAGVGDVHVVEGERTSGARGWTVVGHAADIFLLYLAAGTSF